MQMLRSEDRFVVSHVGSLVRPTALIKFLEKARAVLRPVSTGPIAYVGQEELQRDITNLKTSLTKAGRGHGFLPVVAPASAIPNAKNEFYRNEGDYLFGLAEALRTEYQAII